MFCSQISLLRSELKRKETSLEAERLDHCAAIELAEKKGREKVSHCRFRREYNRTNKVSSTGIMLESSPKFLLLVLGNKQSTNIS